jgi:hypothetical protein
MDMSEQLDINDRSSRFYRDVAKKWPDAAQDIAYGYVPGTGPTSPQALTKQARPAELAVELAEVMREAVIKPVNVAVYGESSESTALVIEQALRLASESGSRLHNLFVIFGGSETDHERVAQAVEGTGGRVAFTPYGRNP